MTVTINEPIYLAPGQWLVEWSSSLGAGTHFWVNLNGEWVAEDVPITSMVVVLDSSGIADLDVVDAEPNVNDPIYPNRARIAWYGGTGIASYRVEEYVGSWTARRTIQAEDLDFFVFESRILEDVTTHQFRVIPIGADDNEGTALTFDVFMVRRPDAPDVSLSYSSGTGLVTVSAA
jgi:hypothetical protein